MRVVILLDHGSREPEANAQLEALAAHVAARLGGARVATAHLTLAAPSLAEAAAACVRDGARELVVLPCFLAPGRHVREDLPRLAAELRATHSGVEVVLAEPLGAHPAVADALAERVREALRGPGSP
ncbi:MAG: cobalamin biosynthesis protein CbiX [Deltaproteobacteria bacterium]|nr:cobalamin biosynthesis protein CbiX [Deltaproteobacteria bacterium]